MNSYYSNKAVQARMLDFLCSDRKGHLSAQYLAAGDQDTSFHREPRPPEALLGFWANDMEICRSLWDREALIVHLDVEYVNFDFPGEVYLNPERTFSLLQPLDGVIRVTLASYGIKPLYIISGRGPHYFWLARQNSQSFKRLVELGHVSLALGKINGQGHRPNGESISPELGRAYAGLGLIMEFLAHQIKEKAAPKCQIPVEVTAVQVGPGMHGREMISLDISEYGDPLSTRVVRVPFSRYLKPWQQRALVGEDIVRNLPFLFSIPWSNPDLQMAWQTMRNMWAVTDLAERTSTHIPDESEAMHALINAYKQSTLRKFHDCFYDEEPHPAANWPATYDRTPFEPLPRCVRCILEHPNDLLLWPANIERLVRVMLSLGWHPRHIAGLIHSKLERDHSWGNSWKGYDPGTRAEFYTRLFAGLVVCGTDELVDFNCQSAKEEKLCFDNNCPNNLEEYKKSLLDRRRYERLACRPFNRLFLPEEHL